MRTVGLALAIAASVVVARSASADSFDYVVRDGDTCDGIAQRFYGDPHRVDLIHQANPGLGPVPHHLKAGQVLHLPPDASLAFVRNHVDAFTPGQHPGRAHEPLMRGHRVSTYEGSGAEIVFASDAVLQLGADTLVVILGATHGAVTRTATADETTLVNGSLRMHLAELAGRPSAASVTTPAGHRVDVGVGEAKVSVDPKRTTRLAVYSGTGKITAEKKAVSVAQGFGSKADQGAPPTAPRPLPAVPSWITPPPAVVFSNGPADLRAEYGPGSGPGPAPARWHVQLARDPSFVDLVVDAFVGLDVTHLEARSLPAGRYFARASAVDADSFEGPSTAPSPVIVSALAVRTASPAGGQAAMLDLPRGLFCAVGDGPLASTDQPLAFIAGPSRRLRCAQDAQGRALVETAIPAQRVGPLHASAALDASSPTSGVVHLHLADVAGASLADATLTAESLDGSQVQSVRPAGTAGSFDVAVDWTPGARTLRLRATANGVDTVDVPDVALPVPPPPPRPRLDHLALAGLAGAALDTGPYPSRPGSGPALSGEVGWLHSFDRWGLELSLHGTWEHAFFSRPSSAYLSDDLYALGIPVVGRLGAREARWTPFVALEPQLLVDFVGSTRQPLGFAGVASLGLTRRAGDLGEMILQVGYRQTISFEDYGNGRRDALLFLVGYRLLP